MESPLSVSKLEIHEPSPRRNGGLSPAEISEGATLLNETSYSKLLQEKTLDLGPSKEVAASKPTILEQSSLSNNRQQSYQSDSKLTQEQLRILENPEERQKAMGRFKSFDMSGMANQTPVPAHSPTQVSKATLLGMAHGQESKHRFGSPLLGRQSTKKLAQVLNVVTKLPDPGKDKAASGSVNLGEESMPLLEPMLAFGDQFFTLTKQKNFVTHNTSNVASNALLTPSMRAAQSSNPKLINISSQPTQQLLATSSDRTPQLQCEYQGGSQVSFQMHGSNLNQQSQTLMDQSQFNQSQASPQNGSNSPKKYEKPEESFMRKAKIGLQKGKDISHDNHYSIKNYKTTGTPLPMAINLDPNATFSNAMFNLKDGSGLKSHIDSEEHQKILQSAIQESYRNAADMSSLQQKLPSFQKARDHQAEVQQMILEIASDSQNSQAQLEAPALDSQISPFASSDLRRSNHAQSIREGAKSEAVELSKLKQSPFQMKDGTMPRLMAGLESVQQLTRVSPPVSQRMSQAKLFQTIDGGHVPSQLKSTLLKQDHSMLQRPRRLESLSARVQDARKFADFSMTRQRVKHHSLFQNARPIIEQTRKYRNISQNATLQKLSENINESMRNKTSTTCLTGVTHQASVLAKFDQFKHQDRLNTFTVEDYYFLRRNMSVLKEKPKDPSLMTLRRSNSPDKLKSKSSIRRSVKQLTKETDVIHVTIDKQSLQQLTNLKESDIRQDENVKLVTSRQDLPTQYLSQREDSQQNTTLFQTGAMLKDSAMGAQTRLDDPAKTGDQFEGMTPKRMETSSIGTMKLSNVQQRTRTNMGTEKASTKFGGTANDETFGALIGKERLNESKSGFFNKTQVKSKNSAIAEVAQHTLHKTVTESVRSKQSVPESSKRASNKSKVAESRKSQPKSKLKTLSKSTRGQKVSIKVDDENKVLQKVRTSANCGNMPMPSPMPMPEITQEKESVTTIPSSPTHEGRQSGPIPIFSRIKNNTQNSMTLGSKEEQMSTSQKQDPATNSAEKDLGSAENLLNQSIQRIGESQKSEEEVVCLPAHESNATEQEAHAQNPMEEPVTNPTQQQKAVGKIHFFDQQSFKAATDQLAMEREEAERQESKRVNSTKVDLIVQDNQRVDTNESQNTKHITLQLNESQQDDDDAGEPIQNIQEFNLGDRDSEQLRLRSSNEKTATQSLVVTSHHVLPNDDSRLIAIESQHSELAHAQPAEHRPEVPFLNMTVTNVTARFMKTANTEEENLKVIHDAALASESLENMEMRGTLQTVVSTLDKDKDKDDRLSVQDPSKIDKQSKHSKQEDLTSLQQFNRMTVKEKREYVQKMERKRTGFMTPGMAFDRSLDAQITQLDKEFKVINFGQGIDHGTFEYFKPRNIDPELNLSIYRNWKQRQIILKRQQLEQRMKTFTDNIQAFKHSRQRLEDFRSFARIGYDRQKLSEKQQAAFDDEESQLLFLDSFGNLHNSSSIELQKMFLPEGAIYRGPNLRREIENKVRYLLGRTELKDIASSAKVLVEISDHQNSQPLLASLDGSQLDGSKQGLNRSGNVTSLNTQQMRLSPRSTKQKSFSILKK